MAATAEKTDPELWEAVKNAVTAGTKGGEAGEWSARKAQMAVAEYKKRGGGYRGKKDPHNHLTEWTEEEWGTNSGKPSGVTHERYLPKAAREAISAEDHARTNAAKRADTEQDRQHSNQPADVAHKTAVARRAGRSKADLLKDAARRGIAGRSRMNKAELAEALSGG